MQRNARPVRKGNHPRLGVQGGRNQPQHLGGAGQIHRLPLPRHAKAEQLAVIIRFAGGAVAGGMLLAGLAPAGTRPLAARVTKPTASLRPCKHAEVGLK